MNQDLIVHAARIFSDPFPFTQYRITIADLKYFFHHLSPVNTYKTMRLAPNMRLYPGQRNRTMLGSLGSNLSVSTLTFTTIYDREAAFGWCRFPISTRSVRAEVRRLHTTFRFSTYESAAIGRRCPGNRPSRWSALPGQSFGHS